MQAIIWEEATTTLYDMSRNKNIRIISVTEAFLDVKCSKNVN